MMTETLQNSLLEIIAILLITSFLVWLLTWLFTRWNWRRQLKNEQEAHEETNTALAKTLESKNEYVKLFDDKSEEYNSLFGDKEALEVTNKEVRQDFEALLREKNALFLNFKNLKADNASKTETITELLEVKNDYGVLLEDYETQQQEKNKLQVFYNQLQEERENLTAELTKERFENQNANKLVGQLQSEVSNIQSLKATENDEFLKLKTDYESDLRYLKEKLSEEQDRKRELQKRWQETEKELLAAKQKANRTSINQVSTQKIEKYKLEIGQLKQQLKNEQAAHSKASEARYNELLEKYQQLEIENQTNLSLAQSRSNASDNNESHIALTATLAASETRYNQLLEKYRQLETENQNNLLASQNAFAAVENQNDCKEIVADFEALTKRHQDLVQKNQQLENAQNKANDKLAIFAKQQQKYDILEKDVAILRKKAEKVDEMANKLSNLERQNRSLEGKLATAKEEIAAKTALSSEDTDEKTVATQLKELQRKNALLKEHNYQLSIDLDEVNKKMGSYQGELSNLSRFKNDYQRLLDKSNNWQNESSNLQKQITLLKEENAQFKDSINNLSVFRTKYKEVVRQNEQLGLKLHESNQNIASKESDLVKLQTQASQIGDLQRQVSELNISFRERNKQIAELQQRLSHAATQKQNLQQQLEKTQKEVKKLTNEQTVLLDEDAILYEISERSHLINFDTIGLASATDKDDLKKIKGIGEFIERKLNALGIYRFEQIARFTESEMKAVTKAIDFFPGRIRRDKWVEQAKKFQRK